MVVQPSSSVIRRNPSCGPCFAAIDELVCWNIDVFITYKNNLFAAVWVDGWHPGSLLYPKPLLRRSYLEFCRSPWMQSAFNIFFYVFCDDRRKTGYLSASYILWFVALSTYTFQIGAAPAIFLISLRETVKSSMRWTVAILRGLADVTSYIVLFAIYLMLWVTTTSNGLPRGAPLSPSLGAFIQSLTAGFWPKHYLWFWIWLTQATQLLTISIVLSLTVLFILLLARFDTEQRPSLRSLGFSLLIGLCVAAPTIFVEMSSDTWTPGTRWPMLYQFWTPLIVALVFFGVTTSLTGHWWHRIWVVGTASLAGFFMLLAFGVNYRQVTLTNEEKAFYGQFLNIVNEDRKNMAPFPRKYEVRLDSPGYFIPTQEFLRKSYAKTILGHDVYFRTINKIDRPNDGVLLIWKNNQLLRAPNPER